jgi:hypothetical protein
MISGLILVNPGTVVAIREPRRELLLLFRSRSLLYFFFLLLDDRFDHDVVNPDKLDLLEDFLLRAITDREHRDDGCNTKDNPQRSQQRSDLVGSDGVNSDIEIG